MVDLLTAETDATVSGQAAVDADVPDASDTAQDRLAAAPMPTAPAEAARPGPLANEDPGVLTLPTPTTVGEAGVPTGFPQTVEGALAQLAAINQSALEAGTLRHAQDVITAWAQPGGPDAETWSGIGAVLTLLAASESPAEGSSTLQVGFGPSMGLIKGALDQNDNPISGSAGSAPVFVVPCVVHVLTVTTPVSVDRTSVADCQRMTWAADDSASGGRWVIAEGAEPAPAPSIWPGSQASVDAGYLWLDQSAPSTRFGSADASGAES